MADNIGNPLLLHKIKACSCTWHVVGRHRVFHRFDPFVLLYNKSLNNWSLGEQWILFSSNLNVSVDFISKTIEILGKQNLLFPKGTVIKVLGEAFENGGSILRSGKDPGGEVGAGVFRAFPVHS